MKTKIIQVIPALLALVAIGFRYFSQWCIDSISLCYGTWIHWIALPIIKPLYFFSLFLLPIVIILAFVPREIFKSWLKFVAWAIPLTIIFIAMTPVIDNSLLSFSRSDAARLAGGVFSAASLLLILWKYFSPRRAMNK